MIMELPEYYLTRAEYEVLENNKNDIIGRLDKDRKVQIIDLGAGDGYKTKVLLSLLAKMEYDFEYMPIDISATAIDYLIASIKKEFPDMKGNGISANYISGLKSLQEDQQSQKLVLFLGSNIGNFSLPDAHSFILDLHASLNPGDFLLTGFDLKKNPRTIISAYDDAAGISARFSLNLLERINRDLGGEFRKNQFDYYPVYNPASGELNSYLLSLADQSVYIKHFDRSFFFAKWETIHTECSNKYDLDMIEILAETAGFRVDEHFFDHRHYFTNSLWKV
jgi:L-histidine Nalpha-methyltransferase